MKLYTAVECVWPLPVHRHVGPMRIQSAYHISKYNIIAMFTIYLREEMLKTIERTFC